jgi:RNA polymerase sigma-70 factor (ECF subfamily)
LDVVQARGRRALPMDLGPASEHAAIGETPASEVAWLGPYPDTGLRYEQREAVELAFVAALQHLPGNQRAALLLCEVLGFSAAEIAAMMDTTIGSVHSALARARRVVADRVPARSQQATLRKLGDARLRQIAADYAGAFERGDAAALVALLTADVTWSMPPLRHWYRGLASVTDFAVRLPLTACGAWRHQTLYANGQLAIACYLSRDGSGVYQAWSVNVLTLREDRIEQITSFIGAEHFTAFGLPTVL